MRIIYGVFVVLLSLTFVGCGSEGGSSGSSGTNSSNGFVQRIPIDSTYYLNSTTGESASLWSVVTEAYADVITQLPPLAVNTIEILGGSEYDEARNNEIELIPFKGVSSPKLIKGESLYGLMEVGRKIQHNPNSAGRAITGEWVFTSSGDLDISSQFRTGEVIIDSSASGSLGMHTITATGKDYNGTISNDYTFEVIESSDTTPVITGITFNGTPVSLTEPTEVDFDSLPEGETVEIIVTGENISSAYWNTSSGQLSGVGTTFNWFTARGLNEMLILVTVANSDGVLTQGKILVVEKTPDDDQGYDDSHNTAPIATVGVQQNIVVGDTVTLDGSFSSDAEGDTITYSWNIVSKPLNSLAVLSDSSAEIPEFTADEEGEYLLSLVVDDGSYCSSTSTVNIIASP